MVVMEIFLVIYGIQIGNCVQWTITIFVGGQQHADSTATFFLDVNGTKTDRQNIGLGNNFVKNEQRLIQVHDDFGKIISVRIFTFQSNALILQKIVLSDGGRSYNFPCNCWIQSDQANLDVNSSSSWTLTTNDCYWNELLPNCAKMRQISCQIGECEICTNRYYLNGTTCTPTPCTGVTCQNNGTCAGIENSYICICEPLYYGVQCQFVDACYTNPCSDGVKCFKNGDDYICNADPNKETCSSFTAGVVMLVFASILILITAVLVFFLLRKHSIQTAGSRQKDDSSQERHGDTGRNQSFNDSIYCSIGPNNTNNIYKT